jgi:hypothetical protein
MRNLSTAGRSSRARWSLPKTRYAKSGELNIAYQVVGDGPFDPFDRVAAGER